MEKRLDYLFLLLLVHDIQMLILMPIVLVSLENTSLIVMEVTKLWIKNLDIMTGSCLMKIFLVSIGFKIYKKAVAFYL